MKIEYKEITVRELVKDYTDSNENGITAYNGALDIRPPYQREFVYKDRQRDAVIHTIKNGFPLNVMYWAVRTDDTFEIIDGQQRTISICQYVNGDFSLDKMFFHNLQSDQKDKILDYKLHIYLCSGEDSEKLDWFETINIAGEKLAKQELRNAIYAGTWLSSAKKRFSKSNCPAYHIGKKYLAGSPIRQDYLETALKWISDKNIEQYMSIHQNDENSDEIWNYFQAVISWVEANFTKYRKQMKGVDWGLLYNKHGRDNIDPVTVEIQTRRLMLDDDVTAKKGIYPYLLTKDEKHLNIRMFSPAMKAQAFENQDGVCVHCKDVFELDDMEADHIKPWSDGGRTDMENCQMLCKSCNRKKSSN